MSRYMYRYEVLVDERKHTFYLTSGPEHVAAPDDNHVEFWAEFEEGKPSYQRAFRVFGTGHELPDEAAWVGTCPRTRNGFVWHLYEVAP